MKVNRWLLLAALCVWAVTLLTGCAVRTYTVTRERADQDITGNRGYLLGAPSEPPVETKRTRTTRVIEFEFGKAYKDERIEPAQPGLPTETALIEAPAKPAVEPIVAPQVVVELREYKVVKGDTLQTISRKFYGTTKKWQKIYDANRDRMKSPDEISPGQIIYIPLAKVEGKVK